MKMKELTPQKAAKLQAKRNKEISRLEKEKLRPKGNFYLPYLIFILSIVYLTDEIASQIGSLMKTEIANGLLSSYGNSSVGVLDIIGLIAIPFQALAIFYKPLSDRFGRKKFLFINTFGLGLGMFLIFLSNNMALYVAGSCMIQFFAPHDMQVVYIMESVPSKHRARIYFTIKSFATLGVMLVPLLRRLMMKELSQWRMVFLIPAIIGMVVSFAALFFVRETDAFIETRLKYLKMTDEEREKLKKQKDASGAQGGIINALKFVLNHKQLKFLYLTYVFLNLGYIITMYYQVVISYGYAGSYGEITDEVLNQVGLNEVTSALFFFPVGSAVVQFLVGIFGDWLGRKKAAVIMCSICLVSFLGFYIGSTYGLSTLIVGLCSGACIGSFWGAGDLVSLMISESAPTNLRSSVLSSQFFAMGVGSVLCYAVGIPLVTYLGNASTGIICLCFSVPGFIISLIVLMARTYDTTGVDLDKVTGSEWD